LNSQFCEQLGVVRFHQNASIREYNRWNTAVAVVGLFHEFASFRVFIDIDIPVGDLIFVQHSASAARIETPVVTIQDNDFVIDHDFSLFTILAMRWVQTRAGESLSDEQV
jgi:hypothetical protein